MKCDQCQELLPEYVCNTLPERECVELLNHINSGCPVCRKELDDLTASVSLLADNLDPVAPRPELKDEIFQRIAEEESREGTPAEHVQPTRDTIIRMPDDVRNNARAKWRILIPYAAAAMVTIVLGSWVASVVNQTSRLDQAVLQARVAEWHERMAHANQVFGPPPQTLNTLESNLAGQAFHTVILHDQLTGQLHVTVFEAPPPYEGRTYYLWLLDKHGKVMAHSPMDYLVGGQLTGLLQLTTKPDAISELIFTAEPPGEHQTLSMESIVARSHLTSP